MYVRRQGERWRAEVVRHGVRRSRTFVSKTAARLWGAQQEAELADARLGKYPRKTLADAMHQYVKTVSATKAGERFEKLRLAALERDFPDLAGKVLSEILTPDIARWRDARLKSVSPGSVQREINLLRNVFAVARDEWHWCGESPFKGLRMPGDNEARERRILPSEVKRICRFLNYETGNIQSKYQEVAVAFLIGLRTAMRAGEILSLTDDRVDLQRRVVTVAHKTQHLTKRPRQIPLTAAGARLLGYLHGRGQYFPVSSASLDAIFRKAKAATGVTGLTFHDSRAEALTRLARRVDVMTLARVSGHKDIATLYSHYYRESASDIASRI
jgi:integrase